jgi:hypothetical protein
VTLYHERSLEGDVYENVSFYGAKKVTVMFDERPSFGKIFVRICKEISYNLNNPSNTNLGFYCPMFLAVLGVFERPPFSWTHSRTDAENAGDLTTTHVTYMHLDT